MISLSSDSRKYHSIWRCTRDNSILDPLGDDGVGPPTNLEDECGAFSFPFCCFSGRHLYIPLVIELPLRWDWDVATVIHSSRTMNFVILISVSPRCSLWWIIPTFRLQTLKHWLAHLIKLQSHSEHGTVHFFTDDRRTPSSQYSVVSCTFPDKYLRIFMYSSTMDLRRSFPSYFYSTLSRVGSTPLHLDLMMLFGVITLMLGKVNNRGSYDEKTRRSNFPCCVAECWNCFDRLGLDSLSFTRGGGGDRSTGQTEIGHIMYMCVSPRPHLILDSQERTVNLEMKGVLGSCISSADMNNCTINS